MAPNKRSGAHHKRRKIVLCFDGTGNKFHGDESDSNILKIFRMLDRTAPDQYHYYQPGIGTYVASSTLGHKGTVARIKSWYKKAKDSAIGSSFAHHVVGGYRFLMRYYDPGDEIYIFGFSRGAYIARFLAEMLDYVGLLSHGNEEMVIFAWKAFSNWQSRQGSRTPEGIEEKKKMYEFMKAFRETFSRPVRRIRFLGLFDTVNSVPQFEAAWMERSRFPYTARTSAKVIRHAVSIDERRAKFRQDLIYQSTSRGGAKKAESEGGAAQGKAHELHEKYRRKAQGVKQGDENDNRGRRATLGVPDGPAPYRARSRSSRASRRTHVSGVESPHHYEDAKSEISVVLHPHAEDMDSLADDSEDETDQDIDEVWFAGGHADVGGGWEVLPDSKPASHVPLVWMVHEAIKAGLAFDLDKVREMGGMEAVHETCAVTPTQQSDPAGAADAQPIPDIMVRSDSGSTPKLLQEASWNTTVVANTSAGQTISAPETFRDMMDKAHTARIHDSLEFGGGLSWSAVLAWKIME
ncbi:hypothetical protein VTK26DRAFT_5854 [Humicola hyalothermophila]